ncbi:hypothetical protein PFICI_05939 [Pestalotiopsis fici W106-1]|uniref:Uncharacterized protein n=1 Tax=Pestalotiopsis fici (strain W106-1 / CGMCC3.15140) TaxID=1229662 RepID=W3XD89_PESFW|nr:uncharacterized protein PFICI_05939 [Pestalotiopsis fici W106-1]ETS84063.1 hypothetical protein PFICI_05939 [Pestalotiopsis fici W106-1]
MDHLVLFRKGGLGITGNDVSTYEVVDSKIHTIEFTSDGLGTEVFFPIEVWKVKPSSDDRLSRKCSDGRGNVKEVELPPYCPVKPESLHKQWIDFLEQHAENVLGQKDEFRSLVDVGRNNVDERFASVIHLLFICMWKTGSGYMKPNNSLDVEPLPEEWKTIPGQEPIPRLIIHCTDQVADGLGTGYQDDTIKLYRELTSCLDAEKAHMAYLILAALARVGNKICADFVRRKSQGAPGTETAKLDEDVKRSLGVLLEWLREGIRRNGITYEVVIGISEETKASRMDHAPMRGSFDLPGLADICAGNLE